MRKLEGQLEELAGTCMSQEVANTFWAYAKMRLVPKEGLMGKLEV